MLSLSRYLFNEYHHDNSNPFYFLITLQSVAKRCVAKLVALRYPLFKSAAFFLSALFRALYSHHIRDTNS